jgi:cytochrome oxidase Cu insertion factor (SCO1/SenC/PrrC family)
MKKRLSPRILLVIIAAMFLLPLLLAWFMYTGTIDYKPASTRNYGELVEPPLPLSWENIYLVSSAGGDPRPALNELAKHWVVLMPVPVACGESCRQEIIQLRQIHRAAGRNQSRVRLALLLEDSATAADISRLHEIYPEFKLITSPAGTLRDVMRQASGNLTATYLVDPLGNIMMVYASGADPNHLKKDLKRLLTWSKLDE